MTNNYTLVCPTQSSKYIVLTLNNGNYINKRVKFDYLCINILIAKLLTASIERPLSLSLYLIIVNKYIIIIIPNNSLIPEYSVVIV